jgi:uncharacterized protein (DUF2062 family)
MRKQLRKFLPDHSAVRDNRWLAPFANTLLHPSLWHLHRRSAAGAVATGMFCGLIPGPFQMLGAALGAVVFRVNLPLALLTTLYTNPLTIVPLYVLAFGLGNWLLGGGGEFVPPPDYLTGNPVAWIPELGRWMVGLGRPLLLGLILLANLMALTGYVAVRLAWRWHLVRAWRSRQRERAARR